MIADHEHRHCVPGQCEDDYPECPICGEPIDYCQGHGALLDLNDEGEYVSPSKEEFVRRLLGIED